MQYIPFSVYNNDPDPSTNFPKTDFTIKLYNNDFKDGTVRIKSSINVLFAEDIVFDPSGYDGSNSTYDPSKSKNYSEYSDNAYHLGFFAALAVEADNVDIDLNGKKFSQSDKHRMHQRFIALIELGSQPFIVGQGPGNFGTTAMFPSTVNIRNGILGSSAHHGIHGNNNDSVVIENIVFEDFEVAAIALNAATNCTINFCHMRINSSTVFVNALFSASIFASKFCHKILNNTAIKAESRKKITSVLRKLDTVNSYVVSYNCVDKVKFMAGIHGLAQDAELFFNKNLDIDGNIYGIILHDQGVAIGPFLNKKPDTFKTANNTIRNVVIENMSATVDEVVGLTKTDNDNSYSKGAFNDFSGSIMDFDLMTDGSGRYKENILSAVQLLVADLINPESPNKDNAIIAMHDAGEIGITNIPGYISDWAKNGTKLNDVIKQNSLKKTFMNDSMNHKNKGVMGLRISGASNTIIEKVCIKNIHNNGEQTKYLSHANEYTGHHTYAVHVSACDIIILDNIVMNDCTSKYGNVYGVHIENTSAYNVTSNSGNVPNILSVDNNSTPI